MSQQTPFEEAQAIIYGDREKTYGHPSKNLEVIALFWNSYILAKRKVQPGLDIDDVCAMMRLVKEARLINTPGHRDSVVDLMGYAGLQLRCHDARREGKAEGT